ncbi:transcription initiation factor tfiid subunit 3 [Anaeramoeba flamelloides]|uniref:Transcription initiation factor tfiid subunit 3 n=1 Tax=Anaeramoeba flamelloides TaxID=1746091 RepID=A0ABQ8X8S8_9EUKA|nr:transcription initiation factor tfiid subunit 3 [Anaeramoeba flamelloides]
MSSQKKQVQDPKTLKKTEQTKQETKGVKVTEQKPNQLLQQEKEKKEKKAKLTKQKKEFSQFETSNMINHFDAFFKKVNFDLSLLLKKEKNKELVKHTQEIFNQYFNKNKIVFSLQQSLQYFSNIEEFFKERVKGNTIITMLIINENFNFPTTQKYLIKILKQKLSTYWGEQKKLYENKIKHILQNLNNEEEEKQKQTQNKIKKENESEKENTKENEKEQIFENQLFILNVLISGLLKFNLFVNQSKKTQNHNYCFLCHSDQKTALNSHIVPKSFLKEIGYEKESTSNENSSDEFIGEQIFCQECDQTIGDLFEAAFMEKFFRPLYQQQKNAQVQSNDLIGFLSSLGYRILARNLFDIIEMIHADDRKEQMEKLENYSNISQVLQEFYELSKKKKTASQSSQKNYAFYLYYISNEDFKRNFEKRYSIDFKITKTSIIFNFQIGLVFIAIQLKISGELMNKMIFKNMTEIVPNKTLDLNNFCDKTDQDIPLLVQSKNNAYKKEKEMEVKRTLDKNSNLKSLDQRQVNELSKNKKKFISLLPDAYSFSPETRKFSVPKNNKIIQKINLQDSFLKHSSFTVCTDNQNKYALLDLIIDITNGFFFLSKLNKNGFVSKKNKNFQIVNEKIFIHPEITVKSTDNKNNKIVLVYNSKRHPINIPTGENVILIVSIENRQIHKVHFIKNEYTKIINHLN